MPTAKAEEETQTLTGTELAKILDVPLDSQTGKPEMKNLLNAALSVSFNSKLLEKLGEKKYKQVLETSANLLAHFEKH